MAGPGASGVARAGPSRTEPVAAGSRLETELFRELLQTSESKALRYAFFSDRAAGKVAGSGAAAAERPIASVGVVGAGTMGSGISICCLDANLPVTLIDATIKPSIALLVLRFFSEQLA